MALPIALIGAGRRAQTAYQPALRDLQQAGELTIVGVGDVAADRAVALGKALAAPAFTDLARLLHETRPAGIIVAVPIGAKDALTTGLLRQGYHLFVETPAAQSLALLAAWQHICQQRSLVVEVAEDEAFGEAARQQAAAVQAGHLGQVHEVTNVHREFAYHAIARLSVLLGTMPAVRTLGAWDERWASGRRVQHRQLLFQSGLRYVHRFGRPRGRTATDWIVRGSRGSLHDTSSPDDHRAGLRWLLHAWLKQIRGEGEVAYGLARARHDLALWQALELTGYLPGRSYSAGIIEPLHAAVTWTRSLRGRLARTATISSGPPR